MNFAAGLAARPLWNVEIKGPDPVTSPLATPIGGGQLPIEKLQVLHLFDCANIFHRCALLGQMGVGWQRCGVYRRRAYAQDERQYLCDRKCCAKPLELA
jgi:hypothetical protein